MNLRNKLDDEIRKFRYENNRYPQGILVHPSTWNDLIKYLNTICFDSGCLRFDNTLSISEYQSIMMYRTLDVKENEFKIL